MPSSTRRLLELDSLDRSAVARALRDFHAEGVGHLATDSLVGESVIDPAKYYQANIVTGLSLLAAMRDAETAALVFSSTAAVYGQPEQQPIREDAPTRPTNPYGQDQTRL